MSAVDDRHISVALCVDRNVLPGLHVTLFTALTHLDATRALDIHLFSDSVGPHDCERVTETLKRTNRPFRLQLRPADTSTFRNLPWQGGWMTYVRLIVPGVLSKSRLLYLDADLLVLTDLSALWDLDMQGRAVGAVSYTTIRLSNDRRFFETLGYDLDAPYLNAGVLLIDREKWIQSAVAEKMPADRGAVWQGSPNHGPKYPEPRLVSQLCVYTQAFQYPGVSESASTRRV